MLLFSEPRRLPAHMRQSHREYSHVHWHTHARVHAFFPVLSPVLSVCLPSHMSHSTRRLPPQTFVVALSCLFFFAIDYFVIVLALVLVVGFVDGLSIGPLVRMALQIDPRY